MDLPDFTAALEQHLRRSKVAFAYGDLVALPDVVLKTWLIVGLFLLGGPLCIAASFYFLAIGRVWGKGLQKDIERATQPGQFWCGVISGFAAGILFIALGLWLGSHALKMHYQGSTP